MTRSGIPFHSSRATRALIGTPASFTWHSTQALILYVEPYDARRPQVCFDESPVQLTSEKRHPLPARPGQSVCYDYEYKREGTANLFLFVQPLQGWRQVNIGKGT